MLRPARPSIDSTSLRVDEQAALPGRLLFHADMPKSYGAAVAACHWSAADSDRSIFHGYRQATGSLQYQNMI